MSAGPLSVHGNAPCSAHEPIATALTGACTVPGLLGLLWKALVLESPKSEIPLVSCRGKPPCVSGPPVLLSKGPFQPFTCCGDATFLPNGKLMVCFWLSLMERHPQAESMEKFNPRLN